MVVCILGVLPIFLLLLVLALMFLEPFLQHTSERCKLSFLWLVVLRFFTLVIVALVMELVLRCSLASNTGNEVNKHDCIIVHNRMPAQSAALFHLFMLTSIHPLLHFPHPSPLHSFTLNSKLTFLVNFSPIDLLP